jgi:cytochrome c
MIFLNSLQKRIYKVIILNLLLFFRLTAENNGQTDCMICHNKEKKVVGLSFIAIANKYPTNTKNVNSLADKIIKGSVGVWDQLMAACWL